MALRADLNHFLMTPGFGTQAPIRKKSRPHPGFVAHHDNFVTASPYSISLHTLTQLSNLSLYSLDFIRQEAVFVQTPPHINLSQAPFLYNCQFEQAQALIRISFANLHELAEHYLPKLKKLIILYTVGRSGSTVMCQALGQLPGNLSLSEPDAFTQLVAWRKASGRRDAQIVQLLQSCILVLAGLLGQSADTLVLKLRSACIELADLFQQAFPSVKAIFLYRHAESWLQSAVRAYRVFEPNTNNIIPRLSLRYAWAVPRMLPLIGWYTRRVLPNRLWRYFPQQWRRVLSLDVLGLMWLSGMYRYEYFYQRGLPINALSYACLRQNPAKSLAAVLRTCQMSTHNLAQALRVFQHHAQANTHLAPEQNPPITLQPADSAVFRSLLAQHSYISQVDWVASGTIV